MLLWLSLALATSVPYWKDGRTGIDPGVSRVQAMFRTPEGPLIVGHRALRADLLTSTEALNRDLGMVEEESVLRYARCDWNLDGWDDAVVATDANRIYDLRSGEVLATLEFVDGIVHNLYCVDLNGDGKQEAIGDIGQDVYMWDQEGQIAGWLPTAAIRGLELTVAQTDEDPALEVILPDHTIFDPVTRSIEETLSSDIEAIRFFDVDGDGRPERLQQTAAGWSLVDAEGTVWWELPDWHGDAIIGDFDGDGTSEVVANTATSPSWGQHVVLDAHTGLSRAAPFDGRHCERLVPMTLGGGEQVVWCDADANANTIIDVAAQRRRLLVGHGGDARKPLAGDLDGDGVDEVLWTWRVRDERRLIEQDRAVLRDERGVFLDILPVVNQAYDTALVDLDGDGDMEIVRNFRVWDWSLATGFVEIHPLNTSLSAMGCINAAHDLDGDGHLELFLDACYGGPLTLMDLSNGTTIPLGTRSERYPVQFADLDHDGDDEALFSSGLSLIVADKTGVIANTIHSGFAVDEDHDLLFIETNGMFTPYHLHGDVLEPSGRAQSFGISRAATHMRIAGDRLWFNFWGDDREHRQAGFISLADNSYAALPTDLPTDDMVLVQDVAWMADPWDGPLWGYELP